MSEKTDLTDLVTKVELDKYDTGNTDLRIRFDERADVENDQIVISSSRDMDERDREKVDKLLDEVGQ